MDLNHSSHIVIHWQIRYFNRMRSSTFDDKNCLLSKRQTATIRQGLEKVCLQEKRARISFRVLKQNQKIFGILVLTDEETFPDTYDPDEEYSALRSWSRHGLQDRMYADITPLTHYLFEICRVFKICMDAWGETLDIIDELVHFKVSLKRHPALPSAGMMKFTYTISSWMTLIMFYEWRISCSTNPSSVPKTTLLLSNYSELLMSG